jgi:hypothetical protein
LAAKARKSPKKSAASCSPSCCARRTAAAKSPGPSPCAAPDDCSPRPRHPSRRPYPGPHAARLAEATSRNIGTLPPAVTARAAGSNARTCRAGGAVDLFHVLLAGEEPHAQRAQRAAAEVHWDGRHDIVQPQPGQGAGGGGPEARGTREWNAERTHRGKWAETHTPGACMGMCRCKHEYSCVVARSLCPNALIM